MRKLLALIPLAALGACTRPGGVVRVDPAPGDSGQPLAPRDPRAVHCAKPSGPTWTADETLSCAERLSPSDKVAVWQAGFLGARTRSDGCRFLALLAEHGTSSYQNVHDARCTQAPSAAPDPAPDVGASFVVAPALACDPWAGNCDVIADELVARTDHHAEGVRAVLLASDHVEVWTQAGRHVRTPAGTWTSAAGHAQGFATPIVAGGQVVLLRPTPQGFSAETWSGTAWIRSGGLDGNFYSTRNPVALVDGKQTIHALVDSGLLQATAGSWVRAETPFANADPTSLAIDPGGALVSASHMTITWATGAQHQLSRGGAIRALGFDTRGVAHFLADDIVRGGNADRTDLAWRHIDRGDRMYAVTIAKGQTPKQCDATTTSRCPQRTEFAGHGVYTDASDHVFALFAHHDITDVRTCNVVRIDCTCPPGALDCGMNPDCRGGEPIVHKKQCFYAPESRDVDTRIRAARFDRGAVEVVDLVRTESNATGGAVALDAGGRIHVAYRKGDQVRYRVLGRR